MQAAARAIDVRMTCVRIALVLALGSSGASAQPSWLPVDLGTLDSGSGWASHVNESGQAVGFSGGAYDRAFLWTAAGGMIDLGTLGGLTSIAFMMGM